MTDDELQSLCVEYQGLLRMRDWKFRVSFSDVMGDNDIGNVLFSQDSQDAEILILSPDAYAKGERVIAGYDPEQVLVHEMLHPKFPSLDKDNPAHEFAIDSIAEALVSLKRCQ